MQNSHELIILPTPDRNKREINVFQVGYFILKNIKSSNIY